MEGPTFLGEYSNESATYFFLIGFFILIIESLVRGKFAIPYKHHLMWILGAFILWATIATILNFDTVNQNFYKQTSGWNRFIRQNFSLLISAIVFPLFFWNIIKNNTVYENFLRIRKVLLFSFIFVSLYGFFEIAIVYLGMGFLMPVFDLFEYLPFINNNLHQGSRIGISSVTFEIPALGTYLIMVLPWMVSYIFTEKNILKYLPLGVSLILLFFSNSRSALIVILLQLIVLLILLILDPQYRKNTLSLLKYSSIAIFCLLLWNSEAIVKTVSEKADSVNFSKNLTKNVSNKSRFGIQHATLEVFKENPIIGVGLGQNTYHAIRHYPYWSTHNNWEFELKYKNQTDKSFPPNYNIYTRLAAELGVIGLGIFSILMLLCIYYSFMVWKLSNNSMRFVGVILIISFVGLSINWMQLDYFRQYGFWLCLMLLIQIMILKRKSILNE
ncbi:O-antigen ligase family protein [Moheibacter stercoris]|uniref:O-antigen ligase n=1 Tax=Moheibacter stercoris TaxID=1628251 RepID=A0ABV2LSG9_9FLAO